MAGVSGSADSRLTADYNSPSGQRNFSYALPATINSESTKEVTASLSDLRKSALQMQKDINVFLTQKMEEDKATSNSNGTSTSTKVDEDKEEDNYGEEVEED